MNGGGGKLDDGRLGVTSSFILVLCRSINEVLES